MRNTFDRGVLHSISRLPITLCFTFVFAGFCCKMYSWNSSTFLISLLSSSFTLSVCIPRFLVPSQQRNHRKSFGKENCCTSAKFYCGKTGIPERAISLHLAQYLNTFILLDALLRIVAEYFCELCHILTSLSVGVKIKTTSKNSQQYYKTKRLIRDLLSNTPNCYVRSGEFRGYLFTRNAWQKYAKRTVDWWTVAEHSKLVFVVSTKPVLAQVISLFTTGKNSLSIVQITHQFKFSL